MAKKDKVSDDGDSVSEAVVEGADVLVGSTPPHIENVIAAMNGEMNALDDVSVFAEGADAAVKPRPSGNLTADVETLFRAVFGYSGDI